MNKPHPWKLEPWRKEEGERRKEKRRWGLIWGRLCIIATRERQTTNNNKLQQQFILSLGPWKFTLNSARESLDIVTSYPLIILQILSNKYALRNIDTRPRLSKCSLNSFIYTMNSSPFIYPLPFLNIPHRGASSKMKLKIAQYERREWGNIQLREVQIPSSVGWRHDGESTHKVRHFVRIPEGRRRRGRSGEWRRKRGICCVGCCFCSISRGSPIPPKLPPLLVNIRKISIY